MSRALSRAPIAGAAACAAAFGAVMFLVYGTLRAADLDARLYENLGRLATPARTPALGTLAHSADPLPLLVFLGVLAIFAFRWDRRPHLLAALGVVAGSAVTTQLLKVVLAHPRVQPAVGHGIGPVSFPSGHATAAMSMAIALVLVVPRRHRWAAVILGAAYAIAVSVTVIILGWHYPSDVLAGTLVATGFGFLALAALRAGGYLKPRPEIETVGRAPSPVLEVCLALAGCRACRDRDHPCRRPGRLRGLPDRRDLPRLRPRGRLLRAAHRDLGSRRGVSAATAIAVKSLTVERGGREVLHGLEFSVPTGAITGLLGPSGCGKTTLMRAIVGVQIIASGTVEVLGSPAGSASLRPRVGYVTQAPSVYGDLSVRENLAYFARILEVGARRVEEVVATVDLGESIDQVVNSLSGGQRSRASLATALLGNPEILVLDEPTVGLDPVLRVDLWRTFADLAGGGKTLLISSHVMEEAARCDSLLLMRDGDLMATMTPSTLRASTGEEGLEDAFLALIERSEGGAG